MEEGLIRQSSESRADALHQSDVEPSAAVIPPEPKHECRSCRWWDMHSLDLKLGDCRAPGDHRYSRVLVTSQRPDGSVYESYALMDSFGPETTLPGYVCGVWDDGYRALRAAARAAQQIAEPASAELLGEAAQVPASGPGTNQ